MKRRDHPEADQEVTELQAFRADVYDRVDEVAQQLYITNGMADALKNQVDTVQGSPDLLLVNYDTMLGQMSLQTEVKNYLLSPVQAYAGRHAIEPVQASLVGPGWPGANPWAQAQQAHQDIHGGVAHSQGM